VKRGEIFQLANLALVVVGSDRLGKWWAQTREMALVNRGGVLGVLPGWWWSVIVVGVSLGLVWLLPKLGKGRLGVAVVAAAGLSNGVDRIVYGGVVDFIHYPRLGFVGNIADIWLMVGVIIIVAQNLQLRT